MCLDGEKEGFKCASYGLCIKKWSNSVGGFKRTFFSLIGGRTEVGRKVPWMNQVSRAVGQDMAHTVMFYFAIALRMASPVTESLPSVAIVKVQFRTAQPTMPIRQF